MTNVTPGSSDDTDLGGGCNEYTFDRTWLDVPLPLANSVAAAYCDEQCRALLEQHHRPNTSSSASHGVTRIVEASGFRIISLESVSAAMGLTPRTLKRRLHAEGTSLSMIVSALRHEAAKALLADGQAVAEVAERLAFADASSFSQAFKRVEAMSPLQFRMQANSRTIQA